MRIRKIEHIYGEGIIVFITKQEALSIIENLANQIKTNNDPNHGIHRIEVMTNGDEFKSLTIGVLVEEPIF